MKPLEVKRIREKLNLTQSELAEVFCLSGGNSVSNIETGFRKPGTSLVLMLSLLDSLSLAESKELVKKLRKQGKIIGGLQ